VRGFKRTANAVLKAAGLPLMRKRDLDEVKRASRAFLELWERGAFQFTGDEKELEEIHQQIKLLSD
jgi:hypothetical protein